MALQGSGQIALSEIADEYGGSAPHQMSEYHDKGNAPASGEIQLAADFYGTSNTFTHTITSNASQVNLRSAAVAGGWDESSNLHVIINSGVTIYSGSTGSYAMVINGSYASGVTLTNNGTILGKGGDGGYSTCDQSGWTFDCGWCHNANARDGNAGGPALQISTATTIVNANGRISGGGGGGGSGGQSGSWGLLGGGGGGGIGNGGGGTGSYVQSGSGSAGSLTGAGGGGAGASVAPSCLGHYGGAGGSGGSWGATGSNGGNCGGGCSSPFSSGGNPGGGGAAGAATSGASNVTWTSTGTRNGSVG